MREKGYEMKKISRLIISILAVSEIILAGCASTNEITFRDNTYFIDIAADELNKGYVEFYIDNSSEFRIAFLSKYIEKSIGDKISRDEMVIGVIGKYDKGTKVRIAEKPGSYTYFVRKGKAVSSVRVYVVEGMSTPVKVNIKNLFIEEIVDQIVKFYEIDVIPEKPIPLNPSIPVKIAKTTGN
jgi:hypothetical protein